MCIMYMHICYSLGGFSVSEWLYNTLIIFKKRYKDLVNEKGAFA